MKVLHIGDNDLISRRFNGYDYHDIFLEFGIESSMIVEKKLSNSDFVNSVDIKIDNYSLSIIKHISFIQADIIHLHLIHNTTFDINYLSIISQLKPTVITLHDAFFLGGHCIHHFDCEKWKIHCMDCEYLDVPFNINYDDSSLRFYVLKSAIINSNISSIVASDWMYDKVKLSPIWSDKDIFFLPFYVDQNIFRPNDQLEIKKKLNIAGDSIVIFFRTQSDLYKGIDIIHYAINNIRTDKEITLISVGETGFKEKFKKKYKILEFGWVSDINLLANLYQVCDLFLMPSKQEAFGLMAIEAMSCGKMVLATKGTALESVVGSPDYGIAVEHDAAIFTKELQRLLDNFDEVKYRGKISLEYVNKKNKKDDFFINLIRIYNDVITQHKEKMSESNVITQELVISQLNKYHKKYQDYISIIDEPLISHDLSKNKLKYYLKKAFIIFFKIIFPSKSIRRKIIKLLET